MKKGQATGLTWMIAIFIIFLISIFFLAAVAFMSKNAIIFGKSEESKITISENPYSNIAIERNFQAFLNKKVNFEDEEITILNLVEDNEMKSGPASDIFKETVKAKFDELFPEEIKNWEGSYPWWLRAYDKTENIVREESGSSFFLPSVSLGCHPSKENSLIFTHYTKNKKVILCVDKEYYTALERFEKNV